MNKDPLLEFETNLRFHLSERFHEPLAKPHWVYISLSHLCNFNCRMCGVKNILREHSLDPGVVMKVLDDISLWKNDAVVVLTGGEPFLYKDIFKVVDHAVSRGVSIELVSNGSQIDSPQIAERIISSGLRNIAISLDGADAATHDNVRGTKGAFEKACQALKYLSCAKKERGSGPQISVWTTIMKENLDELYDFIHLSKDLGVECLVYHPVIVIQEDMQNTVAEGGLWLNDVDTGRLRQQIDKISEYQKQNGFVAFLHDPYLWLDYFRRTLTKEQWRCNPFVFVDIGPDGDVRSCGPAFGNVKELGLTGCLNTTEANSARERMSGCTKPCLQTCWARPEADSLMRLVRDFAIRTDSLSVSSDAKRKILTDAICLLESFEGVIEKGPYARSA
jgi:MoaA/NifB/PqqE/SkfB family radical SAM enzyme